jgi:glycosyltransferase involved in cell wall biosynthesis
MTMAGDHRFTVLQYTGYDESRGGIMTGIGHLAATDIFHCVLGVNQGFQRPAGPALEIMEFTRIDGEKINAVNFWRARVVAQQVRSWLRAGPGRIFHGHSRAGLLVALWLHWSGESRVVASVHCYGRQRWFYRAAKTILGSRLRWLTPAMKRYYYGGKGADWKDCVPNGLPGVPTPAMRRRTGDRPLRIGGAGQLTANKRWHLLLGALARMPTDAPVEFWHAGGPTGDAASAAYAEELKSFVTRHGLQHRVRWLGWQPSSADLLREVDAVIVPFHQESFSLVALEALYAGVPVIAASGGGPDDFIRHGENGWLIPPDDPAAIARQLAELLVAGTWAGLRDDPEHLRRFGIGAVAAQWAEVYAVL